MVKRVLISFFVVIFLADICFGPVGSPGVPSSRTRRSGQSRTSSYSNPQYKFGGSSNDIVTGNVGGGKHFRGVVPYGSPYEFGGSQGSSALSNFYRRSATSGYDFSQSSRNQQFFLPSKAVTTITRPASSGGSISGIDSKRYRQNTISGQMNLSQSQLQVAGLEVFGDVSRPLAKNRESVLKNLESYLKEYDRGEEGFEKKIFDKDVDKNRFEDKKEFSDELVQLPELPESPFDKFKKDDDSEEDVEEKITARDVYEQMLEKANERFQEDIEEKRLDRIAKSEEEKELLLKERQEMREAVREALKERHKKFGGKKEAAETEEGDTKKINTFASSSKSRFNKYMSAAEELMAEGKFYKAADVYSLASAYDHTNPLSYAGRTHALFAAGDYMSSAFYLDRTLRIFGGYVMFNIGIEEMVGDWDTVEGRIVELKELGEKNGSAELMFLLAYVYHNTGQDRNAKNAIDEAMEGLEDNKAAKLLYDVIYGAENP